MRGDWGREGLGSIDQCEALARSATNWVGLEVESWN